VRGTFDVLATAAHERACREPMIAVLVALRCGARMHGTLLRGGHQLALGLFTLAGKAGCNEMDERLSSIANCKRANKPCMRPRRGRRQGLGHAMDMQSRADRTSAVRDCVLSVASGWLLPLVSKAKEKDSFPASRGAMTPFLPGDQPNPVRDPVGGHLGEVIDFHKRCK